MHHRHKHEKHQTKDFYKVTQNYNPKKCKKTSQEKRQYTSNETLWPVRVTIVASKAAMLFLSIVLDPHVSVNNTKSLSVVKGMQQSVPLPLLSSYKAFCAAVNNTLRSSCKVPDMFVRFKKKLNCTADFRETPQYKFSLKSI